MMMNNQAADFTLAQNFPAKARAQLMLNCNTSSALEKTSRAEVTNNMEAITSWLDDHKFQLSLSEKAILKLANPTRTAKVHW